MKFCPNCAAELAQKTIGGVERAACRQPDCGFVFWDNPVPVVAAIVEYNDHIVLARNAQWPQGVFSMITGYLERNESPESAVLREVKEELGLDGQLKGFIGHYAFARKNQLILAYAVNASGEIQLNHEIAEVKLVARDEFDVTQFAKLQLTARIFQDWLGK
ncbi:MAG: NUDIX domain-containing protein [Gammaproteobacteria bacterium]|nr:NUDIX domain-containing protein [Gammaproteobacteria bacterium]